jgi:hypothetical protein
MPAGLAMLGMGWSSVAMLETYTNLNARDIETAVVSGLFTSDLTREKPRVKAPLTTREQARREKRREFYDDSRQKTWTPDPQKLGIDHAQSPIGKKPGQFDRRNPDRSKRREVTFARPRPEKPNPKPSAGQ